MTALKKKIAKIGPLKQEIPEYTRPYIDDVPVRGLASRYEISPRNYETIPENSGIQRFI